MIVVTVEEQLDPVVGELNRRRIALTAVLMAAVSAPARCFGGSLDGGSRDAA